MKINLNFNWNWNRIELVKHEIYKNPTKLFGFLTILLSLIILITCHFHLPDFYTNRELADNIAQKVYSRDVYNAVKNLLNPKYNFYNFLFQIWGYFLVAFIFSLIFKIKEFKGLKEINIFNKKLFVYLWINLSYVILGFFYVTCYMLDLEKYVYNGSADSMGIPFFEMIGSLIFIGNIYYPVINILSFVTYNTNAKRIFLNIVWGLGILFLTIVAISTFIWRFTYLNLFLNFIYIIWFLFIINAMKYQNTNIN